MRRILHAKDTKKYIPHLYYDFGHELCTGNTLQIISNENLSILPNMMWEDEPPIHPELFARNLAFFRDYYLEPEYTLQVLVTLRRQDTWLAARYAQSGFYTKHAGQKDFECQVHKILSEKYATHGLWLDYNKLVSELLCYFPKSSVHLLLQEDLEKNPQIWLAELTKITGANSLEEVFQKADPGKKRNTRQAGHWKWRLRGEGSNDVTIELTNSLSEQILNTYKASNALLCKRYNLLGHEHGYW